MEIEKKVLRLEIRKRRAPVAPEAASAVRSRLLELDCWRAARTILAYHPLPGEIDLQPLIAAEEKKEWVFPRIDGETLTLHRWEPGASWIIGPFGIREPDPERWPAVGVDAIDLALIPALAFDSAGNRLGRGKGYYDRFLGNTRHRGIRIGVITDDFLLPAIPTEPHDIPMDLVVTESAVHIPAVGWTTGRKEDNPKRV